MTDRLRVILEIGKKCRVVAGAMDWPGRDRWGTSEDDALEKLSAYRPRYTGVPNGPAWATTLDAIRAYNRQGKAARTWPLQFLVRRTAQHVMDHAWELEDRGLE